MRYVIGAAVLLLVAWQALPGPMLDGRPTAGVWLALLWAPSILALTGAGLVLAFGVRRRG